MRDYKKRVKYLIKNYGTRDPYNIATGLGIRVKFKYLSSTAPKGIFKKILKKKFIIINMTRVKTEAQLNFILAHELGHAERHHSNSAFFLHDHTFYARGKFEKEANEFAAELLIDTDKINEYNLQNPTINQLVSFLNVPIELIKIKYNIN